MRDKHFVCFHNSIILGEDLVIKINSKPVGCAAVRSKAVILLLIHCLLVLPLCGGFVFGPNSVIQFFVPFPVLQLSRWAESTGPNVIKLAHAQLN